MTVADIVQRVQSELEDAVGSSGVDWTDQDYILSKLATCSDDIGIRLQVLDLNYNTAEVIIANIPANTESLAAYQATGKQLSQMIIPKSVEWRLVGQGQQDWQIIDQVDKLIDTDTSSGEPGVVITSDDPTVESWEFREGVLSISPCMEPVDLRIRSATTIISLTTNSQQQIAGLTNIYVYKCCEKIAAARGVGTNALSTYFMGCYEKSCADFEALSVKSQQSKVIRLGGRRSGMGSGWDSNFRNPVV